MNDAKELADIYYKEGYVDVEAKAGVHHGTFKVFVNYISVADITNLPEELFITVQEKSLKRNNILYAPPDYLRMSMYLELSRPEGDVSRWEKVLKRLVLLNKVYPIHNPKCNLDFIRKYDGDKKESTHIYNIIRDSAQQQGLVFFGGYASELYNMYINTFKNKFKVKSPDFDIISEYPETSAEVIKDRLMENGYDVVIDKKNSIGEIIPEHYEILVGKNTVAMIYKPLACHNYNTISIKGKVTKVATIDTMMSFYLAFLYANRPYYSVDRIYCMSQYLFTIQHKNRLKQKGLLKRFGMQCIGKQPTIETMRDEKSKMYEKLKNSRGKKEYDEWFLKYNPSDKKTKSKTKSKSKTKT